MILNQLLWLDDIFQNGQQDPCKMSWHLTFMTLSMQKNVFCICRCACVMDGDAPTLDGVDSLEDGQLEEEEGEIVREKIGSDISDDELDFGDADGPASPAAADTSREVYSSDGEIADEPQENKSIGQQLGALDTEDISAESAPASPEPAAENLPVVHSPSEVEKAEEGELEDEEPSEEQAAAAEDGVAADAPAQPEPARNGNAKEEGEEEEEEEGMLSDSGDPPATQENSQDSQAPGSHDFETHQVNASQSTGKGSKDSTESNSDLNKVDIKINVQNSKSVGTSKRTVFTVPSEGATKESDDVGDKERVNGTDKLASSFNKASIHDDHGELDYDEELGDEEVQKKPAKQEEEDERVSTG